MAQQSILIARPVEKPPRSKFYCNVRRLCSGCGFIHLYRKVDEANYPVRYICTPHYQPWLVGEEATTHQEKLF
jgi:hypothetical protein